MLVELKFDTESESTDDLTQLHDWVGKLLEKRGVSIVQQSISVQQPLQQPIQNQQQNGTFVGQALQQNGYQQQPVQNNYQQSQQGYGQVAQPKQEPKKPEKTAGGCRYIDYDEKVEDMMSSLLCRQTIRR